MWMCHMCGGVFSLLWNMVIMRMCQELMSSCMKSTQNSAWHSGNTHYLFLIIMMVMMPPKVTVIKEYKAACTY